MKYLRRLQEALEGPVCRTIGCSSVFSYYWEWPHRYICVPMTAHYIPKGVRGALGDVPRETTDEKPALVVAIRLSANDIEVIEAAAKKRGTKVISFMREAALEVAGAPDD